MAHPIKKQEFLGAVTLVSFSVDGSLLYVGVGPTIFLYNTASGDLLGEHQILTRGILHGCDVVRLHGSSTPGIEGYVGAFFGQKRVSCFQNLPQSPEEAQGLEELTILGKSKVFCDWVFDVQLLSDDCASEEGEESNKLLAAVGLAHNLVQIWNSVSNEILRSVQCADRCILYALAFHGRSQDTLVVASGTVFQQILLWDPMVEGDVGADFAVAPAQRLHAHDGVLFKLAWSSDAQSLASVSDDRTVQLWSNNGKTAVEQLHLPRISSREVLLSSKYSPVFRAWGHSARIWDVSFWEYGVATASEDGLCKLWDHDGKCVATLQGHMGRNVWRTAVHPSLRLIATGGGDGAAKLWDIPRQLMSSSGVPGVKDWCESIMVPIAAAASASTKKMMSSHSVRNIVLNPLDDGNTAFVASEHGDIFRLDLVSLAAEPFFTTPVIDSASPQGRSGGLSTFTIDSSGRFLLLGYVTGRVCIVEVTTGALLASGVLYEWKPTITEASESMASPVITMQLVGVFKIPAKSSIASILVVDRNCDTNRSSRWTSVATGVAHTTTVRALTTFRREGDDNVEEHIVISGGGKQRLNVWLVCGESDLLRHVCGHERAEAAQDHRILGLATFVIPTASNAYRLVAACNSEGSTQFLLLDLTRSKLVEIGDCRSVSRKPILSCVGFQENNGDGIIAGLAVGSTDGLVTLWNLSVLLEELAKLLPFNNDGTCISDKIHGVIEDMQPSGSYLAHDMGANCIALVSCTQSQDQGTLDVALISGGDDQNLFLCELRFPSCEMLGKARAINASGSAIKTVACVDAQVVFAAGYDQRVSKWHILRNEHSTDAHLEWQSAAFSECADIADLAVRREGHDTGVDNVVVVGQGLQVLQFQRE
ncbi:hypothetical protein G195_003155 [Phytophthora kernoviae 00238/432]|uniref:Anaphase-promoting complex subunit 4 WD40 domain-containing protein n=1 Tax=Phytophthora kernoviae 00238/432 TaxID=1284355 RepID=A0A8J4SER4_9STRA|nr:hypothetical protein G195_003155 [Phytophthora kernoviae 00238/432]